MGLGQRAGSSTGSVSAARYLLTALSVHSDVVDNTNALQIPPDRQAASKPRPCMSWSHRAAAVSRQLAVLRYAVLCCLAVRAVLQL